MHASALFQVSQLERLIEEGLVSRQNHPTLPYFIYNYTNTCQFAGAWNDVTLNCRGLILDDQYNIIARPFPKFFNIEEHSRSDIIWKRPFQLFEKVDGSLGILYPTGTGFQVATRGSFCSDQAEVASRIWADKYSKYFVPPQGYTVLFEIIYPENRIVVDYKGMEDLVFLAAVHNETGANLFEVEWPGPAAKRYDPEDIHPRDLKEKLHLGDNAEGFVLYFPHANQRVKVKFEEYVAKHRLIFGISSTSVWENLSKGHKIEELVTDLPDEYHKWAQGWSDKLRGEFADITSIAARDYVDVSAATVNKSRKDFALLALKKKYPQLLFMMYDKKPADQFNEAIWKMIKPKWERPTFIANVEEDV